MITSLVVAMDEAGGIGFQNRLPWRLSADLKRFKQLTMGHHLIMGRRTYQSIGRILPGRTTIVVSRNHNFQDERCPGENCFVAPSLRAALELAAEQGETEAFVVGGSQVFAEALPLAQRIYLTDVHAQVPADVFFPSWQPEEWQELHREFQPADANNQFPFTFRTLVRKGSE